MDAGFLIGLVVASVAAVTDLAWGIVPNLLTYPAIVAGVVYAAMFSPHHLGYALLDAAIAFGVALALNLMGVLGGGDVKLLPSLALFLHRDDHVLTGLDVLLNSILLYAPLAVLYLTVRAALDHGSPFLRDLAENTLILALVSLVAGGVSRFSGTVASSVVGITLITVIWLAKSRGVETKVLAPMLAVPAILLSLGSSPTELGWELGIAVALSLAFTVYRWGGRERKIEEVREGDIPLEVVVKTERGVERVGRFKGTLLIATGRAEPVVVPSGDGFTEKELEKLKRLGVNEIKVGHATPFAPAIALGYVLTYVLQGSPISWLWG